MLLIDEFSTGVDAKMKRDMWNTLRNVAVGKAVIITTRKFMTVVSEFPTTISVRFYGGSIRAS